MFQPFAFPPGPAYVAMYGSKERREDEEDRVPEPQRKRKGFCFLEFAAMKKKPPPLPVVQTLRIEQPTPNPPLVGVTNKLGSANLILGFDVEADGIVKTPWVYSGWQVARGGLFCVGKVYSHWGAGCFEAPCVDE